LGYAAKHELVHCEVIKPVFGNKMVAVPFRGKGNPDVDVR
jgi:hypothetical protein